jgi:outer membrane protein assembly factor BamE (lipoprotein component of BamABCDE complex)
MTRRWIIKAVGAAFLSFVACAAHAASGSTDASRQAVAQIVPGQSTKADIESLLGAPWRVVQFNDCGMAMDGQADETWEYRGTDQDGNYRLHVEFSDNGVVRLIAKIPDGAAGGKATDAKVAPPQPMKSMSM